MPCTLSPRARRAATVTLTLLAGASCLSLAVAPLVAAPAPAQTAGFSTIHNISEYRLDRVLYMNAQSNGDYSLRIFMTVRNPDTVARSLSDMQQLMWFSATDYRMARVYGINGTEWAPPPVLQPGQEVKIAYEVASRDKVTHVKLGNYDGSYPTTAATWTWAQLQEMVKSGPPAPAPAPTPAPTPAPAPPAQFDPRLRAIDGTFWRSSTGFLQKATLSENRFGLFGESITEPLDHEEIGITATGPSTGKGVWVRDHHGKRNPPGTSTITIDSYALSGELTSRDGQRQSYFACRSASDQGARIRWSGDWMWSQRISHRRDESNTHAALAVIEVQNVSRDPQTIDFATWKPVLISSDGRRAAAGQSRDSSGQVLLGQRTLTACERLQINIPFPSVPYETDAMELSAGGNVVGTHVLLLPAPPAQPEQPSPGPAPQPEPPAPVPAPAPPPPPAPRPVPAPTPAPGGLSVPSGAAGFQSYGPWEFRVDELLRGPDGHIQAVVTVRNASQRRMPFTITDIDAFVIDADGHAVQRHGNLYRVAPGGPAAALVNAGSSQLEPGDEVRGRLLFPDTREFEPAKLRLKEPVSSQTVNTYPMR